MGRLHKDKKKEKKLDPNEVQIRKGLELIREHGFLSHVSYMAPQITGKNELGRKTAAISYSDGRVQLNKNLFLSPKQWAFAIAHCMLHNCFGHYDLEKVPGIIEEDENGKKTKKPYFNKRIWNIACDIYIDKFLEDINFGEPLNKAPTGFFPSSILDDEIKIYDYLIRENWNENDHSFGVGSDDGMDMSGLENPLKYEKDRWGFQHSNEFAVLFADAIVSSVRRTINKAADREWMPNSMGRQVANWFINNYPLFGALAASFKIVEDQEICRKLDISTAAVNAWEGEIYINTRMRLSEDEWKFVMAHEFLHAALLHHRRCEGRDPYLWNLATDFVINGWLFEMQIGSMPEGVLFDPDFRNKSAEEIYDIICEDFKRFVKMNTFRGNGQGDIMGKPSGKFGEKGQGVSLDDFYRNALTQGLEYETGRGRGLIPAGLVEEIRALAVPPVPWDVKLAEWFNANIRPLEKHRSYAHPSRRQSSTPDIPRPRYVKVENGDNSRTFGVIIDTSGSMEASEIGKALGAVASYAAARDVPAVRVVFCDARAYDNGYMSPDEIAGRVKVIGRGGTRLQPAIDLIQSAKDFPKDGPILIITDGGIEDHLDIRRTHAFILPAGYGLPFKPRGEVFYFK
ncbi:MAG: hypothetical protein IJ857_08980 [Lachnospiraceae bacterium]|nr:hypothetical protein [Lachnospiraceae bacterium]